MFGQKKNLKTQFLQGLTVFSELFWYGANITFKLNVNSHEYFLIAYKHFPLAFMTIVLKIALTCVCGYS